MSDEEFLRHQWRISQPGYVRDTDPGDADKIRLIELALDGIAERQRLEAELKAVTASGTPINAAAEEWREQVKKRILG